MAGIQDVLNGIHTDNKDPFQAYAGHSKLATIDICSYQDASSTDLVYTYEPLADDETSLSEWLNSYPSTSRGECRLSGGVKLLVVHIGGQANAATSLRARRMLKSAFDQLQLPTASLTPFWARSSDFMSFPRTVTASGPGRQAYCLVMRFWALTWSYDPVEKLSRGIVVVERDYGEEPVDPLEKTINALKGFVDQPCFLGFAAIVVALTRVSASILKTYSVSKDMKYRFQGQRTNEPDAVAGLADPSKASTDVLNHTSRVLGYHDRLRILQNLNTFLSKQLSDFRANMAGESEARRQRAATLDESLIHMEQKITSLVSVTQKVKDRATMQVAALFNIIAQNDSKVSIEIAVASRALAIENKKDQRISIAIAKASRAIAVESKRDSSSMKTIAAVTMLFLPGTFVASLFATPMFQWSATAGLQVQSHIWVYWATSIPLTLLTIGFWWVWLKFTRGSERAQLKDAEDFNGLSDFPEPSNEAKGAEALEGI
jgi:hypothetical protein